MKFEFDNSYANRLEGFYASSQPAQCPAPQLLYFNPALAAQLGLDTSTADNNELAQVFSGNRLPKNAQPIAQAYAGHQFGQFNPQLGDGRALIIGEALDTDNNRFDLCLKGSGQTPFSRGGDGKAALGPMLREVLIAEAMHALGIPTTRSLAVVGTGEAVYRDPPQPGAILTRTAASHIRIGSFQFFAAREQYDNVQKLADYSIARHDTELIDDDEKYLKFLRAVIARQAGLIAQWMGVGFIHGVMNTDNITIAGETIDYGPCAFMEGYSPKTVFSSIDHQGRYAYGNQPAIGQWNLTRLAETLLPLIDSDKDKAVAMATEELNGFALAYQTQLRCIMRQKLGLQNNDQNLNNDDDLLVNDWLDLLERNHVDYTLAFRGLCDVAEGNRDAIDALFKKRNLVDPWLAQWRSRCEFESDLSSGNERAAAMRKVNPWIIPRNHKVEEALQAASDVSDFSLFEGLLDALEKPFEVQLSREGFALPASADFTDSYQTFCGT